ncbi:MAG: transketolase [Candidatus Competibacteraceae bacterium]|nr:transketolase [Candidatus Competibacteraceae bacterium]
MGSFPDRVANLTARAREVRFHIVRMIHAAQSGHPGGSLSAADIMTALYFDILRVDPGDPRNPDRDRFVLSKGHACPVWYACLALRGFFPVEELLTLRRFESRLQGHPVAGKLPGIDATTGSLGVGFGQAVGMALEGKMRGKGYKVYAVLGDGETQEGIVWEAAASANKYGLDNLVAIIDNNGLQNDGFSKDVMPVEPLDEKFRSFGWDAMRINGHDMAQVLSALDGTRAQQGRPLAIIAATVKGRGVSYMENVRGWHGKPPSDAELATAVEEIAGGLK